MRQDAIDDLARSGITPEDAQRAGMWAVDDASTIYPEFRKVPAIVIPYYETDGKTLMRFERDGQMVPFVRVRYLDKLPADFRGKKPPKYGQPIGSGTRAYFSPLINWADKLNNPDEPLLITEGEKKATAAALQGFPIIALGGVFNFTVAGTDTLLPELAAFRWTKRDVFNVFDSDAAFNPNILAAEARLVDEIQRKRGARFYLVRLPQDGEAKIGIDDYLLAHGAQGLVALLQGAQALNALDAKVVALNKSCAWIERENLIYDLDAKMFIPKESFVVGSRFSSLVHIGVGGKNRTDPKQISIAKTWLTHPHAQRFSEILFRPGEGQLVVGDNGRQALNMWTGWEPAQGDVRPFLELTAFLFQNMRPEDRDLPLKLIAYKVQNPHEKIPLALVLLGPQGCGKTLWGECVRDAFGAYGIDITPSSLAGEFQGWLERSLFALINEAKGEDIERSSEQLKALISDLRRPMNEKFRPVRQINTYTMYCITSNKRAVGSFSADDRRMIVIDCPKKREPEFYHAYVKPWKEAGGPRALLGYLLNLDLKGWRPPSSAPMSPEKFMAYTESLSPVQRLAEDMRSSTTQTVVGWLDQGWQWSNDNETSSNTFLAAEARAIKANIAHWQIRDWYTPEELAMIFPQIVQSILGSKYNRSTPAGAISRELRDAGVPYLTCADDPRGFRWKGRMCQFLVVSNFEEWKAPLRQADFERLMQHWPKYSAIRAGRLT